MMRVGMPRGRHRRTLTGVFVVVVVMAAALVATSLPSGAAPFATGDVLAAIGNGAVKQFAPNGTLKDTLTDQTASAYTTGMAFDAAGNLFVTDFSTGNVSKFDSNGTFVSTVASGLSSPESLAFDNVGDLYVSQVGGGGIAKYDASGNLLTSFPDAGRVDWMDLAADNCTMLYTQESTSILRFDVCTNTTLDPLTTSLPASSFALRIRPSGEILVASSTTVERLSSSGSILQTYTFPSDLGVSELFALNLDPDGTSFWTGDIGTNKVIHVDIATGNVLGSFDSAPNSSLAGLAVKGEIVVGATTTTGTGSSSSTTSSSSTSSSTSTSTSTSTTTTIPTPTGLSVSSQWSPSSAPGNEPGQVEANDEALWTASVTNTTGTTAPNVVVRFTISQGAFDESGTNAVNPDPINCSLAGPTIIDCTVGSIPGGATRTVSALVDTAGLVGPTTVDGTVTATAGNGAGGSDTSSLQVAPDDPNTAQGFVPPGGSIEVGPQPNALSFTSPVHGLVTLPNFGPGATLRLSLDSPATQPRGCGGRICDGQILNITNPDDSCGHPNCLPFPGYRDKRHPIDVQADWFRGVYGLNRTVYIIKPVTTCRPAFRHGRRTCTTTTIGRPLPRCINFFGFVLNTPCVQRHTVFANRTTDHVALLYGDPGMAKRR